MSINLIKHKEALLAAYRDVLDDKTSTNWALFGYEGQTNDLKFVSKGSNGIEELTEDLNSGKIMYAFLKVTDPKTSLPKNVLIYWQGEGAPNVRKGTCANHVREVSNLFNGAHVTVNARTEEEVDTAVIMDKVSKATGSVYKFNERTDCNNDCGPVGTAYKRTIPKQEINAQERDKFWEQQEEEERERQESERRRTEEERKKAELERQLRDSQETALREAKILEATKSINEIRLAEKASFERSQVVSNVPVEDLEKEELERRNRADILRRQRSEEAQSLIAKRTVDARAVFEQNTAAGQFNQRRSSVQPRVTTAGVTAQRRSSEAPTPCKQVPLPPAKEEQTVPVVPPSKEDFAPSEVNLAPSNEGISSVKEDDTLPCREPEPTAPLRNGINGKISDQLDEVQEWEDEVTHNIPVTMAPAEFQDPLLTTDELYNGDLGLTAKALYDYQAADETEITFDPGDLITHIDQIDEGWWQGLGPDGTFGLFPANYVDLIK